MYTLGDVRGLLLKGGQDVTGLVIKSLGRVIISNVFDTISDYLLVVNCGLRADLTKQHDHTGLRRGLTSYFCIGVLFEVSIKHSITNLVTDFVWMAFSNR